MFSMLNAEFSSHQCKNLVNSKSTSKRLLAAHFLSLHAANLKVKESVNLMEFILFFYSVILPLEMTTTKRSLTCFLLWRLCCWVVPIEALLYAIFVSVQ